MFTKEKMSSVPEMDQWRVGVSDIVPGMTVYDALTMTVTETVPSSAESLPLSSIS